MVLLVLRGSVFWRKPIQVSAEPASLQILIKRVEDFPDTLPHL